jgi:hypothetical protein
VATLLSVGTSECTRRCDAHCHNATEPDCDCICAGRYHGRGLDTARELLHDDLLAGRLGAELAEAARDLLAQGFQQALF